jgi:hypothetical protein
MTILSLQQTADFAVSPTTWSFFLCRFKSTADCKKSAVYYSKFKAVLKDLTAMKVSFSSMAQKCSINLV